MNKKHIETTGIPEYLNTCENAYTIKVIRNGKQVYRHTRCGKCNQCLKHKTNVFALRLLDEADSNKYNYPAIAVKMTIDKNNIETIIKEIKEPYKLKRYELINKIATIAIRKYTENYRSKEKITPKHWLITDTEKDEIIIRGIIFQYKWPTVKEKWKYGTIKIQLFSIRKAIINITDYLLKKTDDKGNEFKTKIFTSKYIGAEKLLTYKGIKINEMETDDDEIIDY